MHVIVSSLRTADGDGPGSMENPLKGQFTLKPKVHLLPPSCVLFIYLDCFGVSCQVRPDVCLLKYNGTDGNHLMIRLDLGFALLVNLSNSVRKII